MKSQEKAAPEGAGRLGAHHVDTRGGGWDNARAVALNGNGAFL